MNTFHSMKQFVSTTIWKDTAADKFQSENFDVAKVSLHITILYRHAVEFVDGKTSTKGDPQIIK